MSVETINNILKSSLIPSNKSEFKFNEYKIDVKKLHGLCEIFNIDVKIFNDILNNGNNLTQEQINGKFKNEDNNTYDNLIDSINNKITNSIEYDKELLKELIKKFDFSTSKSINQQTNSIDFLKLFEEITHKQATIQNEESTTSEEKTTEEESTTSEEETLNEANNGVKYLILLFREFGIISKDKRTNKINPDYIKYFIKQNKEIKTILNNIDFDYFEPKKTNGRIIRLLKLLKVIKEKSINNNHITKKQLLEDLMSSEFIEASKQDKQTYYYIKKGLVDDFNKWLIKKYF